MGKCTIVDRLRILAKTEPDVPAFIFWGAAGRRTLTKGEVYDLSSRYAFQLNASGVKPGDVVCVVLPNSPERLIVDFGIQMAGAVSLNGWRLYDAAGEDLISALTKSDCTTIVLNPKRSCGVWNIIQEEATIFDQKGDYVAIQNKRIPALQRVLYCHKEMFLNNLPSDDQYVFEGRKLEDVAVIFPTSGGAANSKLVPYTHRMLATFATTGSTRNRIKFFNSAIFGWLGGYPASYLWADKTILTLDELSGEISDKWSLMWEMIVKENATAASMTPAIASALSKERVRSNLNHRLKFVVTSGQPVKKSTIQLFRDVADHVMVIYGMSETATVSRAVFKTENPDQFEDFMAGKIDPGIEVKIVDENMQPVAVNTRGEILIKSEFAPGYLSDEEATKKAFMADGWFRSGDVGYMRDGGCLFVEGRKAHIIMHGTYILYPTWLETRLADCPGVKAVAVVPVPDKVLHHEICACIIRDTACKNDVTEDDVVLFNKKQFLLEGAGAPNISPKYVLFFDEFPLTFTKKVNRHELALKAKELLNLV